MNRSIAITALAAALLLPALPSLAQDEEGKASPNRMLIVNELGQYVPFNLDHVADIRFVNVEGEASASMEILELTSENLEVKVELSEEASQAMVGLCPRATADDFRSDLDAIDWLRQNNAMTICQPVQAVMLSEGIEMNVGEEYSVLSAGADRYGTWDRVERLDVKIPWPDIVGDPVVTVSMSRPDEQTVEVTMDPNADVWRYYFLFGTKGRYQQHYEEWREYRGYESFEDMVMQLGQLSNVKYYQRWSGLYTSELYEVIVVCLDRNGTPVPAQIVQVPAYY